LSEQGALSEWKSFFLWRLPTALLLVAVVTEVAATLLGGVTLHRHNVDDLANAVVYDTHPYRTVLLGDSVTHIVAHRFRIGAPDEVADLTTHALAGLPSSLFVLRRYLESGHRPRHVVIATTRDVFVLPMDKSMFGYYVTSVFTRPDERAFLTKYYGNYVDYSWRPAALSVTTRLGEPLFSLLRHPGSEIWSAREIPAATPHLERYEDLVDPAALRDRIDEPDIVRPEARAVMREFCALSRQYGFALHLIWAPMQSDLHGRLVAVGKIRKINEQLAAVFSENHLDVPIEDSDDGQRYPYFDRTLTHIKGDGWEQLYALELSSYIHHLDSGVDTQITASK
jgi:hypothetical protein